MNTIDSLVVRLTALPVWLFPILLAAGTGFALWYYRDPVPPASRGMRHLLVALRAGAFALLFLALAEPVLGIIRTATRTFRVAMLLDTSSSMEQAGNPARREDALAALETVRSRLGNRGLYLAFDERIRPLRGGEPVFTGPATDLASALKQVAAERDIAACVVIGDGRWNRGEDPAAIALPEDIPVHTVLAGEPSATPDVVLRAISAPPLGHDARTVPVEITVAAHGTAAGTIPVEILEKGRPAASGTITLQEGAAGRVVLDLPLRGTGEHTFTARVIPSFADRKENNSRTFTLRVLKSVFRVLLLAPSPSPDRAFLRRTVEADSALAVRTVISAGSAESGGTFPDTLPEYDAVIILDGGGFALTPERMQRLARRVSEGMGLWMLGSTPIAAGSALASVLPVAFPGAAAHSASGPGVMLSEAGRNHFVTASGPDRENWETLPPLSSLLTVQPGPESVVLLTTAPSPQRKDTLPVLVAGTAGKGKTLAMPVSGFWRWRLMMEGAGKSGAFFDTFVRGAVRWLTSEAEISPLTVVTDTKTYLGGQEIFFEGRVFDAVYRPVSGAEVSLTLDGDSSRRVILDETRSGVYTGSALSAVPGDHSWAATAYLDGNRHGEASGKYTVESFSLELLDSSPDPESLRALAERTGGLPTTAAGIDSVLQRLTPRSVAEREERERYLALHPLLPGLIILLLSVEWFIRKRRGMI
jgi:hypothetical protein